MYEYENPMTGGQEDVVGSPNDGQDENPLDDGREDVVDSPEEGAHAEESGSDGETGEKESGTAARTREKPQTYEDNAAAKAARLRAQQETEARLQREYDGKIAGMGVSNPYTGKPFQNFKEFEEYAQRINREQLEARAKRENRPVEELQEEEENKAYLRQKRQEDAARRKAQEEEQKTQEFLRADAQQFAQAYPNVDIAKVEGNEKFRKFAKGRLYKEPLAEIYGDFLDFTSEAEQAALARAKGKAQRSTGAGGSAAEGALTQAQQTELSEWNREYPHMKMTAKEFFGR